MTLFFSDTGAPYVLYKDGMERAQAAAQWGPQDGYATALQQQCIPTGAASPPQPPLGPPLGVEADAAGPPRDQVSVSSNNNSNRIGLGMSFRI
mgnify:CR=1 FL=1